MDATLLANNTNVLILFCKLFDEKCRLQVRKKVEQLKRVSETEYVIAVRVPE